MTYDSSENEREIRELKNRYSIDKNILLTLFTN